MWMELLMEIVCAMSCLARVLVSHVCSTPVHPSMAVGLDDEFGLPAKKKKKKKKSSTTEGSGLDDGDGAGESKAAWESEGRDYKYTEV